MPKSTTTNEILEAVNELSNNMDKRFDGVETRLDKVEATMVTKDYLDKKIAEVKGYLVGAIKNEDNKVNVLTKRLYQEKSLSSAGEQEIISLKPFPEKI